MRQPWWVALSLAAALSLQACASMPAMKASPEDQRIANEIRPKLRGFSPLRVDVRNGMVYVSGVVSTAAQREAAERVIREVPGVTGVMNNVHVGPHAPTRP
jgi:osmotically-inducible protein OsmY